MEIEYSGNVRITITFATYLGRRFTSFKINASFGWVWSCQTSHLILLFPSFHSCSKFGTSSRAPSPCKKGTGSHFVIRNNVLIFHVNHVFTLERKADYR
jgi:hypothetical protein